MTWLKRFLLIFLILLSTPVFSQSASTAKPASTVVRVGYIQHSPFVVKQGSSIDGMTVDIWELIANKLNWKYQYELSARTLVSGFQALKDKKIDVLIGAVSVDSRGLEKISFSRPYFINRIGVIGRNENVTFWDYLSAFAKKVLNINLVIALLIFLLFCHILWLFERRHSMPESYLKGIGSALWLGFKSFVANESNGTKRLAARLVLSVWLLLSVTTLATFTASITSALTMSLLSHSKAFSIGRIRGKHVAVIKSTIDTTLIDRLYVIPVYVPNLAKAVELLEAKKVFAVIDDLPSIRYYLHQHPSDRIGIAHEVLGYDEYAFAFRKNSPLLKPFDLMLDHVKTTFELKYICTRYVGPEGALLCDV